MAPDELLDSLPTHPKIDRQYNGRRNPNVTFIQEFVTTDGNILLVAVTDLGPVPHGD